MSADPHRVGAIVLSGLLHLAKDREEFVPILSQEDFTADDHRHIFVAIRSLMTSGLAVDLVSVCQYLVDHGINVGTVDQTPAVAAASLLAKLWDEHSTNTAHYVAKLRDASLLRGISAVAAQMGAEAENPSMPAMEVLEQAESSLFRLAQQRTAGLDTYLIGDLLPEAVARIDSYQAGEVSCGIATGIGGLDELIGGLRDRELVIVGARPSNGKTSLALTITQHTCSRNVPVLFCSLEQGRGELVERLLSMVARVDGSRLRERGGLSQGQAESILSARDAIGDWPLHIDDDPVQSVFRIQSNARRLRRRHNIQLVVVDYIGLIQPENRRDQRRDQIGQISRSLKGMARSLGVPVLALAQLNRESERRADPLPKLSDLRDSGEVEQDADVVILLHRHKDKEGRYVERADAIVAKQRNGPTGPVPLRFLERLTTFEDYEYETPFQGESDD